MVAQERVEQLVAYWREVFRLHRGWQIACVVHATRDQAEAEDTQGEDTPQVPAYVRIQHGYSRASLRVNAYLIESDEELTYAVGHEIAHIPAHRPSQLILAALGPANAGTAEELGEELTETLVHAALFAARNPPPLPPEVPVDAAAPPRKARRPRAAKPAAAPAPAPAVPAVRPLDRGPAGT